MPDTADSRSRQYNFCLSFAAVYAISPAKLVVR
jgi:hypothetical protein